MSASQHLDDELWEAGEGGVPPGTPPPTPAMIKRLEWLATAAVATVWMAFHIWTTWRGNLPLLQHLSVVVAFAASLVFVWHPFHLSKTTGIRPWWASTIDVLFWFAGVGSSLYLALNFAAIQEKPGIYSTTDLVAAIVLVVVILEGCRRTLGWALPILAVLSIAFAYYGGNLGPFSHRAFTTERIFSVLALSRQGMFTAPLAIVGTFLALYMLLAAAMQVSGTGQFFVDVSRALFGRRRGGTAKVATTSSAAFGMISGAGVANAATTGAITIPMMKQAGYAPQTAAAMEAVASIGGQLMPPVMGAAAFMIGSFIGTSYSSVVKAALLPAIAYYLALWFFIDIRSRKLGMRGEAVEDLPRFRTVVFRDGYHLLPVVVLLWSLLGAGFSPARSGLYGFLAAIAVSWFRRSGRITPRRLVEVFVAGARMTIPLVMAVACVGIVIGVVSMSGIGIKLSGILIDAGGGSLFLLLLYTMLASLVLGTGLPTTPTYLFLAILVAPALGDAGISLMAAHLFIFYYGVLSDLTPPLAVAPFVAAGIAGADPWRTTFVVLRVGLAAWFLPFMFVYSPALLMEGTVLEIVLAMARATLGIFMLSVALERFLFRRLRLWETVLAFAGFVTLVVPTWWVDLIGVAILVVIVAPQWRLRTGEVTVGGGALAPEPA